MAVDLHEWVDYVKSKVRLQDVLKRYNVRMSQPNSDITQYHCPIHSISGDTNPSARVYENGTSYCWGCGKAFDSISFVQEYEGFDSFVQTLRHIEQMFGLPSFKVQYEKAEENNTIESRLTKIFNQEGTVAPEEKWQSVNALLIRNRDHFVLMDYLKVCRILDYLKADIDAGVVAADKSLPLLQAIQEKILRRSNGNENHA